MPQHRIPPRGVANPAGRRRLAVLLKPHATPPLIKPVQTFKGEPAVFFEEQELSSLAARFNLALIGKFAHGKPTTDVLYKEFQTIGLKGSFTIGWLDHRHVLLRFDFEEDYLRIWMKGSWSFRSYPMRVFKWNPDFQVTFEPSIVPVWIDLKVFQFIFFTSLLYSPLPLLLVVQ